MSLHGRDVQRETSAPAAVEKAPAGAQREAAHLLRHPSTHQASLRELPSNHAAIAAAPPMEIAGVERGPDKSAKPGLTRTKDEDRIIKEVGKDLAHDFKNPNAISPSEKTYHRIEGLVQNEYKEHGNEGLKYIESAINYSYIKAQRESGVTGAPNSFGFSGRVGKDNDLLEARVSKPVNPQLHHSDFDFHLTP
jgi:hypothetical protein